MSKLFTFPQENELLFPVKWLDFIHVKMRSGSQYIKIDTIGFASIDSTVCKSEFLIIGVIEIRINYLCNYYRIFIVRKNNLIFWIVPVS